MFPERRRFFRLDSPVQVLWNKSLFFSNPLQEHKTKAINISESGICLSIFEKLEVDDVLSLKITLGNSIAKSKGQVRWIREFELATFADMFLYDVGIELLDLKQKQRRALRDFIVCAH